MKRLVFAAMFAALAVGVGQSDQAKTKVIIPIERIPATSGKQMYFNYCAPCHGMNGRGQGPVAPSLKTPPPDLTRLSRANQGKYPEMHVVSVLQNGVSTRLRGPAEMPVWGPILGTMSQTHPQDRLLRVSNLDRFLETLQVK